MFISFEYVRVSSRAGNGEFGESYSYKKCECSIQATVMPGHTIEETEYLSVEQAEKTEMAIGGESTYGVDMFGRSSYITRKDGTTVYFSLKIHKILE
jgi:hypothetical protein